MTKGPICPEHNCHPSDCFEIHYPESARETPVDYDQIREAIIRENIERQNDRIRAAQEKMSLSDAEIVDARERFERSRKGA